MRTYPEISGDALSCRGRWWRDDEKITSMQEVRAQLARWLEFQSCNNLIPFLKEARESHLTHCTFSSCSLSSVWSPGEGWRVGFGLEDFEWGSKVSGKEDELDGGSWANADLVSAAFWVCNYASYKETNRSSQSPPKGPCCGGCICGAYVTGVWVCRPHGFCECHSHTMADDSGTWRLIRICFFSVSLCVFLSNFAWTTRLLLPGRKEKKFLRLHYGYWKEMKLSLNSGNRKSLWD